MYEWNICKSTVDEKGFLIKTISKQAGTRITALKHLRSCFDFSLTPVHSSKKK